MNRFSIYWHDLTAATQAAFRVTANFDIPAQLQAIINNVNACAVSVSPEDYPAGYVGQPGDALRPLAGDFPFGGAASGSTQILHAVCPWPVANTGYRLAFVIAGLLGSAFFGFTLTGDKSKTAHLKWFLGALAAVMTLVCIIDSDRVGFVSARLFANAPNPLVDPQYSSAGRFVAVCVFDILCALEAVRTSHFDFMLNARVHCTLIPLFTALRHHHLFG